MTEKDLLLSIDNGTQSLKALVFDACGNLLAKEQVLFTPYFSDRPGWAEQDPFVFWSALCRACQGLLADSGIEKSRLAGVSVTTQRGTVVNLDKEGQPLRPAILWLDQRKCHGQPPLGGAWGLLFKVARLTDTLTYFQSEVEASWIARNQPDVWSRTHKFLLLSGYLNYRLTGRYVDSVGSQVGYLPFDYKRLRWARSWDWKWRCVPVRPAQLPQLVPPGQILGAVSRTASRETGIPEGLPVVAAAADKACEVIGSGSLDPSVGCLSYGTTATVNITHRRYIEPIPLLPAYPSAIPGFHAVEVQVFRGFWMVNWFKEEFGLPEQLAAEKTGVAPEDLFENLIEDVPPGSLGLMLQPFWTPGIRKPGPEAKGAVIGFGDIHTRAHLYRSILEGLAYALREGKERIEQRSKIPICSLRVSGGGSQSDLAMQLTADVFGLPTTRPHLYETSGLGAAIDSAVGLGLHPDFETAVAAMTHTGDRFEPDASNHKLYDALYRKVYKRMYRRLQPLYQKIREITGYPE
ncbi:carbohydrate kinase [Desulfosarcina widdelii]|uniref:Carbohydrate kinase n=1 Tax=Desulfosarcina widdelii TaxID=947919 RepID=A0A5K7Z7L8_9BACT|nr:FGGY-family carbohydrate kinase [Desulfosarcina widdelii]BBO77028.1 carbohydrate kinase [Desulfosarcina widdelii]